MSRLLRRAMIDNDASPEWTCPPRSGRRVAPGIALRRVAEERQRTRVRQGIVRALDHPQHLVRVLELLGRVTGELGHANAGAALTLRIESTVNPTPLAPAMLAPHSDGQEPDPFLAAYAPQERTIPHPPMFSALPALARAALRRWRPHRSRGTRWWRPGSGFGPRHHTARPPRSIRRPRPSRLYYSSARRAPVI
jgi:hypothetical protein